MTERINEYKVEPSESGGWWLYRKEIDRYTYDGELLDKPKENWSLVAHYRSMRRIKKMIAHLSTPTRYFQFGTV